MRDVILVHGLWVPGVVMSPLAARLERSGFRCRVFGYAGRNRPLQANVERLAHFARSIGPAHFVGHSLGGLVLIEALHVDHGIEAGSVVLLGTPARGCFSGRRLARRGIGRWLLGESGALWFGERAVPWTRPEPLGVIAGTLPMGLGRAFGRLPGPSDGVVCVEETAVQGMAERILLPVGHSMMLVSGRVAAHVESFLLHARFLADGR